MTRLDYKRMFAEAQAELEALHARKTNIETELEEINTAIEVATRLYNTIAPVLDEPPLPTVEDVSEFTILPVGTATLNTLGISVAVQMVLEANPDQAFTSAQMRDRLTEEGYDWKNVDNPLPAVHTVLMRLTKSGKAQETRTPEGTKAFYSARKGSPPTIGTTTISGIGRYRPNRRFYLEDLPPTQPPPGLDIKKK